MRSIAPGRARRCRSRVTPTPAWASAVPQAERGRPDGRATASSRSGWRRADDARRRARQSAPTIEVDAEADAERRQHRAAASVSATTASATTSATPKADDRRCAAPSRSPRFQASDWPNGSDEQQRHHQRHEGEVEEGRADRDLVAGQRLQRERIERADEAPWRRRSRGRGC